jgi:hypothetical protein
MSDVLDDVHEFLHRFVAYPSEHAQVAHTLWIAHTWLMDCWDSTPRIAFLSPEPGSGKSRCIEVTGPLVPRPVHAVNVSSAYLFRKISDEENGRPTILYDEIDTVFGYKTSGENEDVRGLLNAGHRKGAVAGRCVIRGKTVETEELPVYCAVAMAGLNDVPDTLMTRSVIVRMRRRAPNELVEPWRARLNEPEAYDLADRLSEWANEAKYRITWPVMPDQIQDRNADVWEALLAVADAVGGEWPKRARVAAVALVAEAQTRPPSLGIMLLRDIRKVFKHQKLNAMATKDILDALVLMVESPWGDLRGKPLDNRALARYLDKYDVKPKNIRIGEKVLKGYEASDLADPWARYLGDEPTEENEATSSSPREEDVETGFSLPPQGSATAATAATRTQLEIVPPLTEPPCRVCGDYKKLDDVGRCVACCHVPAEEIA